MKSHRRSRETVPPEGAIGPGLPAWKAFVVQFSREASPGSGPFTGRVEHLSSGRRAGFASRQELLDALERLLAELDGSS